MVKYWYLSHDYTDTPQSSKRVWLDGWASDTFEVLTAQQFSRFKDAIADFNEAASKLNLGAPISLVEMHDD